MQHLDDGRLQSWLDRDRSGIPEAEAEEIEDHVASCEACADRLAALERTSEGARSLLAVAAPSGEVAPDFEDVVRRARRRGPAGGSGRWWRATGWAASLVAALGLGWLSNDLLRPGTDTRAPTAAAEVEAAGTDVAATEADVTATEAERRELDQARATLPPPATREPDPDITIAATAFEDTAAPAEPAEPAEAGRFLPVLGRVSTEDGRPLAGAQVSISGTGMGTLTREDGSFSFALSPDALGPDAARSLALTATYIGFQSSTQEIDPGAADSVSVDFRLAQSAVALDELMVTGVPRAPAARVAGTALAEADRAREVWVPMTRARAEEVAAFELLIVPELRVLEIELGGVEGQVLVRVRQALDSGATLTLVQQRDDGTAVVPTLPMGQPVATVRWEGLRVTGSAPIAIDSLRALLDALR